MAEAPKPYWEDDSPASGNTFFGGYTIAAFKKLSHAQQMKVMAAHERKRGARPKYCQSDDKLTSWTALVPRKKRT
jgi:hypothetical protein